MTLLRDSLSDRDVISFVRYVQWINYSPMPLICVKSALNEPIQLVSRGSFKVPGYLKVFIFFKNMTFLNENRINFCVLQSQSE